MDHFFSTSSSMYNTLDDEIEEKISLDELYDRKRDIEIHRLNVYRRILSRVHTKIKLTARQKNDTGFMFYLVPEFIFGVPKYNINTCISYIIQKLEENGFLVKYTHPNLLFISWQHYIPSYKREQIKRETGKTIDGFGNIIEKTNHKKDKMNLFQATNKSKNENKLQINHINENNETSQHNVKKEVKFKDISSYKPSGIYSEDILKKIQNKLSSE